MGRSLGFWLLLTLVLAGVGLALDKGFADNTPPYDEPTIAIIGWALFMLSGAAFLVLCAVALTRLARRRWGGSEL
jgi:drug/metabolite transporter (DMT)-like permease